MIHNQLLRPLARTSPIMVSGVYRSGTTFLASLLGSHPNLFASSSTVKYLRFCLDKYGDISKLSNLIRLLADTKARLRSRWKIDLNIDIIQKQVLQSGDISNAVVYDMIMRHMLGISHDFNLNWVEKLAVQWEDIPKFLDMFPNGKVIHVYRDPRDTCASYKAMTSEPGYTYLDAVFNFRGSLEYLQGISTSYKDKILVIKIEDISSDLEAQTRKICSFLDIDYSQNMTNITNMTAFGEDWSTNTSFDGSFNAVPKPSPRWTKYLDRHEVCFVELFSQPYLADYGYSWSGYVPSLDDWIKIHEMMTSEFISSRVSKYLETGRGSQGYRSDPYLYEMQLVFPDRYESI